MKFVKPVAAILLLVTSYNNIPADIDKGRVVKVLLGIALIFLGDNRSVSDIQDYLRQNGSVIFSSKP